jgi:hypothetical protein
MLNLPRGPTATGGVPVHSFRTEDRGVIAHFAHLAWYYFKDHANKYCSSEYDPRHFGSFQYKYSNNTSIEYLNGKWAVPGRIYAQSIAELANQNTGPDGGPC